MPSPEKPSFPGVPQLTPPPDIITLADEALKAEYPGLFQNKTITRTDHGVRTTGFSEETGNMEVHDTPLPVAKPSQTKEK